MLLTFGPSNLPALALRWCAYSQADAKGLSANESSTRRTPTAFRIRVDVPLHLSAAHDGLSPVAGLSGSKAMRTGDEHYKAVRIWARIFGTNFALRVVTGIPMEFQFGTNWAEFSKAAGRDRKISSGMSSIAGNACTVMCVFGVFRRLRGAVSCGNTATSGDARVGLIASHATAAGRHAL